MYSDSDDNVDAEAYDRTVDLFIKIVQQPEIKLTDYIAEVDINNIINGSIPSDNLYNQITKYYKACRNKIAIEEQIVSRYEDFINKNKKHHKVIPLTDNLEASNDLAVRDRKEIDDNFRDNIFDKTKDRPPNTTLSNYNALQTYTGDLSIALAIFQQPPYYLEEGITLSDINVFKACIDASRTKVDLEENYKKYGMIFERNKDGTTSFIELQHPPDIDTNRVADILTNFDNVGYVPPPHSKNNTNFFSIVIKSFRHEYDPMDDSVSTSSDDSDKGDLEKLEKLLNAVDTVCANDRNKQKLISWGLDDKGINIALIKNDTKTVEDFCYNNEESNIFIVADYFKMLPMARIINTYHNRSFDEMDNITISKLHQDRETDHISLSNIDEAVYSRENSTIQNRVVSIVISDYGETSWDHNLPKLTFDTLSTISEKTYAMGTGNGELDMNKKVPDFLSTIANENNDLALAIINQHGIKEDTKDFHDVVSSLPRNLAKNTIYYLEECHSAARLKYIDLEDLRKSIGDKDSCLYIATAKQEEVSYGPDTFNLDLFSKSFPNPDKVNVNSIVQFFATTVAESTPQIKGVYKGKLIEEQPLSTFNKEALNPEFSITHDLKRIRQTLSETTNPLNISPNKRFKNAPDHPKY